LPKKHCIEPPKDLLFGQAIRSAMRQFSTAVCAYHPHMKRKIGKQCTLIMNANAGKQKRHSDPEEMGFANSPRIFASVFTYSGIVVGKNHWYFATSPRVDRP